MPPHHIISPKYSDETPPTHCPIESCKMPVEDAYHLWEHLPEHKLDLKQNDGMILCPFKSEGCQTYMAQWGNLEAYYNRHLSVEPHECPVPDCDRAFADPASRTRHLSSVHGRRPRPRKKPRRRTGKKSRAKARANTDDKEEGEYDADSVAMSGYSDEDADADTNEGDDGANKNKVKEEAFKALRAMFDLVAQPASPSRRRVRTDVEARNVRHGQNSEQYPAQPLIHPVAPAFQGPGQPYACVRPPQAYPAMAVADENWPWHVAAAPPTVAPVAYYGLMMPSQRQNVHQSQDVYSTAAYAPSLWPETNYGVPQNAVQNDYFANAPYYPVQPNAVDMYNHWAAADLSKVYPVHQPPNNQFNSSQSVSQPWEQSHLDYDPSHFPPAAHPATPHFEDPSGWQ